MNLVDGFFELPWWGYIVVTLLTTHVTIAAVTIYLHRCQAHRALELHPLVSHFFRFWLWFATGTVTKEWVAIHRKHHAKVETDQDPHSPVVKGINTVLWNGYELYRDEAGNQETLDRYGHETPNDWLERHLYSRFSFLGIFVLLLIDFFLFGLIGITVWAVQMIWIPFFAAGVINGLGHWRGYRNFETTDTSTNIIPFGILIGGEELHNNHHAFASSAKLSVKPWEFDLGWLYIKALSVMKLANVKKLAPVPIFNSDNLGIDYDTVSAVITNRLHVMSTYTRKVVKHAYKDELRKATVARKKILRRGKKFLHRTEPLLDVNAREHLENLLADNETLQVVCEFRDRLQNIWQERTASRETLVKALQEWCRQAEETGIEALEEFSFYIKTYTLVPQPAYVGAR